MWDGVSPPLFFYGMPGGNTNVVKQMNCDCALLSHNRIHIMRLRNEIYNGHAEKVLL